MNAKTTLFSDEILGNSLFNLYRVAKKIFAFAQCNAFTKSTFFTGVTKMSFFVFGLLECFFYTASLNFFSVHLKLVSRYTQFLCHEKFKNLKSVEI